jgi:hypothetical protein
MAFGPAAMMSASSSSSSSASSSQATDSGAMDVATSSSASELRKRGMRRMDNVLSSPPSLFLANLDLWARHNAQRVDDDKPHPHSDNAIFYKPLVIPAKQTPGYYYPDFVFCQEHKTWSDLSATLVERTAQTKTDEECNICIQGAADRLFVVVGHLLKSNTRGIEQVRADWQAAFAQYTILEAGSRASPDATAKIKLNKANRAMVHDWVVYESLVWDLAHKERARLVSLAREGKGFADDEHGRQSASALVQHHGIFATYCEDSAEYRHTYRRTPQPQPAMYCTVHNTVGDAVPSRHPQRYLPECFICPRPKTRRPEDADGDVVTGKSIFGLY